MLVDIDIDKFSQSYLAKFKTENFKDEADCKMLIRIVSCMALDFDLDPELEPDDVQEIVDKTTELGKTEFTFEIGDDGIEVDI